MSLLMPRTDHPNLLLPRERVVGSRAARRPKLRRIDGVRLHEQAMPFAEATGRLWQKQVDRLYDVLSREGWWIGPTEVGADAGRSVASRKPGLNPNWKDIAGDVFSEEYRQGLRNVTWYAGASAWTREPIPFGGWDIGNGIRVMPPGVDTPEGIPITSTRAIAEQLGLDWEEDDFPPGKIIRGPYLEQVVYAEAAQKSLVQQLSAWAGQELVPTRDDIEDFFLSGRYRGVLTGLSVAKQAISKVVAAQNLAVERATCFRWSLNPGYENCIDCEDRDGDIYTPDELDAFGPPGSMNTACGSNCKCSVDPVDCGGDTLATYVQAGLDAFLGEQDELINQAMEDYRAPRPIVFLRGFGNDQGSEAGDDEEKACRLAGEEMAGDPDYDPKAGEQEGDEELSFSDLRALLDWDHRQDGIGGVLRWLGIGAPQGMVEADQRALVVALDSAVRRSVVQKPTSVFGFMSKMDLGDALDLDLDIPSIDTSVLAPRMSPLVGREFTEYSFMKAWTTGSHGSGMDFIDARIDFVVPRGTAAINVDLLPATTREALRDAQGQIMLPRGMTFRIDGVVTEPSRYSTAAHPPEVLVIKATLTNPTSPALTMTEQATATLAVGPKAVFFETAADVEEALRDLGLSVTRGVREADVMVANVLYNTIRDVVGNAPGWDQVKGFWGVAFKRRVGDRAMAWVKPMGNLTKKVMPHQVVYLNSDVVGDVPQLVRALHANMTGRYSQHPPTLDALLRHELSHVVDEQFKPVGVVLRGGNGGMSDGFVDHMFKSQVDELLRTKEVKRAAISDALWDKNSFELRARGLSGYGGRNASEGVAELYTEWTTLPRSQWSPLVREFAEFMKKNGYELPGGDE